MYLRIHYFQNACSNSSVIIKVLLEHMKKKLLEDPPRHISFHLEVIIIDMTSEVRQPQGCNNNNKLKNKGKGKKRNKKRW